MCRFRSELFGTEFDLSDMIVGQAVHALKRGTENLTQSPLMFYESQAMQIL